MTYGKMAVTKQKWPSYCHFINNEIKLDVVVAESHVQHVLQALYIAQYSRSDVQSFKECINLFYSLSLIRSNSFSRFHTCPKRSAGETRSDNGFLKCREIVDLLNPQPSHGCMYSTWFPSLSVVGSCYIDVRGLSIL